MVRSTFRSGKLWHNDIKTTSIQLRQYTVSGGSGHCRPTSETPFEWRFAGGPKVARLYMYYIWNIDTELCHHTYFEMVFKTL